MAVTEPPTDETISNFLNFVGPIDRRRAIRILKFHNNDVSQAINDYFDNPDSSKYDHSPPASQQNQHWDEEAFNSNRDGSTNTTGISFTIEGNDEFPPNYGPSFDGAPSRPPSRTSNNRSPRGVIDFSAQAAAADPSTSRTYDPNRDPELQQALAASLLPQESGVTSTDQVVFGPANRSQYEPGKWDLVPVSQTSAREVLDDPDPEDRKRDLGVPAFLKPSVEDHRLGALFTIYHEIPMLREMFLDRANVIANYGSDRDWWAGAPIEASVVTGSEDSEKAAFVHEVQRLMAFLDKTDRSYGSADALANSPLVRRSLRSHRDLESAVLEAFRRVFDNNQARIKKLFSRGVDGPEENNDQVFAILQLPLPSKESCAETIYDIADSVLWDSTAFDLNCSPFLTNIGEVITFRFTEWDDTKKKGVAVPAVWYPDRYLDSGRQAALQMRLQKREVENELQKICMLENGLTNVELRSGKIIKVQELFRAALQHDMDVLEDEAGAVGDNIEERMMFPQSTAKTRNLSSELRKLVENIDRKLLALKEEKEKAREALRHLSKLYTEQQDDQDQPILHKYTLRGVSISKSTMYICRQAEPELIDIDLGSESSKSKPDQWWRIHYATSELKPVNVEKTTEAKVLEAASESQSSMLVYASEKAMAWTSQPLPTPLEQFVRKDNAYFKNELPTSNSPVSSPKTPTSPGKRKTESSESSDEALQEGRYRGSVKVSEKEIGDADFEGAQASSNSTSQVNGSGMHEMIETVNPIASEPPSSGQEMQERSSMRMLAAKGGENTKPVDLMDLVMEDDNIAQESGAVRHVGFTE